MTSAQKRIADQLAETVGYVMTEPTNYRIIVELNTYPDREKNDPHPLPHYYMIDGAHEALNPGHTEDEPWDCDKYDMKENADGVWVVDGIWATDHNDASTTPTHPVHMPAVIKWVKQMIIRNRVQRVYADCY